MLTKDKGAINMSKDPLTKLIETISAGVGRLYEPTNIRRIAKAKCDEIELIGNKISEMRDLPIKYNNGSVLIDGTNYAELARRAQNRLAYQELKKQNNIDNVVEYAANCLADATNISDVPVDNDWITRFFDSVADVSSEAMQKIWSMILAGEIKRPGSVSLRTLNVIKHLEQKEALDFEKLCPYILRAPGDEKKSTEDFFIISDILLEYEFDFPFLEHLSDAGLLSVNGNISTYILIDANEKEYVIGSNRIIEFQNNSNDIISIIYPAYMLTQAGRELYRIAFKDHNSSPDESYIDNCMKAFLNSINDKNVQACIIQNNGESK